MRVLARCSVVAAFLAVGCGSSGGGSKQTTESIDDAGAGDEAGPPGRRGGGGGAFGGADDDAAVGAPDGAADQDAPSSTGADALVEVDTRLARDTAAPGPDVASAPDLALAPDQALPVDLAPATDLSLCDQCGMIETDYAAALARARVCTVTLKGQCQQKVSGSLTCPCNNIWVNSTAELDAIAKKYQDTGCGKCRHICPLACVVPSMGVCVASKLALPISPGPDPVPGPIPIVDKGTCADQNSVGP